MKSITLILYKYDLFRSLHSFNDKEAVRAIYDQLIFKFVLTNKKLVSGEYSLVWNF
jgi:hypothetical protein